MSSNFSNLPLAQSSLEPTIQAFNAYFSTPIEINASAYAALTGFFTNRGFDISAAESISTTILVQAKQDGYNPMQILDTLKGLTSVDLSGLVAEILNYNRFKTSNLGNAQPFDTNPEIKRNIMA
jgi:hypothetical protein